MRLPISRPSLKNDYIGRKAFGEPRKVVGEDILISLVQPRFCKKVHDIVSEKQPITKKILNLFPKSRGRAKKDKNARRVKEKETVVEVLAASIIKLSSSDQSERSNFEIPQLQIHQAPPLFAENGKSQNRATSKTGIRKWIESQYENVFHRQDLPVESTIFIRDSMQDIMFQPLKNQVHFEDYFEQFWEIKVKSSFSLAACVVIDFDTQERDLSVPKDGLRAIRDDKPKNICADVQVEDREIIPVATGEWNTFLANRHNKKELVLYIAKKLEKSGEKLENQQTLLVSYEGKVTKVTNKTTTNLSFLGNTHDEADTRVFLICSVYESEDCVIRSTDSDILFNALLNHDKLNLNKRTVLLQYTGEAISCTEYCVLNDLVDSLTADQRFSLLVTRNMSPAKFVGFLHFLSGSDDISFLNGFSKHYCITNFVKYHTEICPDDLSAYVQLFDGSLEQMFEFFSRFLIVLYCKKYSACFEPKDWESFCMETDKDSVFRKIRDATWHKTIVSGNQLPTSSAIRLHCKRLCFVMKRNGSATNTDISLRAEEYGWMYREIEGVNVLLPQWEDAEVEEKMSVMRKSLLKKCGCKKNKCRTNACGCVRDATRCTKLCTCTDCDNDENNARLHDDHTDESSDSDESSVDNSDFECEVDDSDDEIDIEVCDDNDLGDQLIFLC